VLGRVESFDNRLQLEIRSVEATDDDPAGLAPRMRRDADELDGFLEFLAGEVSHPGLSALVAKILGDAEIRKAMRELPAAESHHSYAGGLLEHTVGVATLARETSQLHPRLRADLLLAAALLHDVGRVRELTRGRARPGRARRAPACGRVTPRPKCGPYRRGSGPLPREPARRRRGDSTRRRLELDVKSILGPRSGPFRGLAR
jgi:hypothetical protein